MISSAVTPEALDYATSRIEDFASVQADRDWPEKLEAIAVLLEGLGMDEDIKGQLSVWVEGFIGKQSGELMVGLLLGLFVNQFENDRA